MKISSLTVSGFRGFNAERSIDFNDRLTLVYAPNSYGKTSITEALEWLIDGATTRVERADSKDEHKGSYGNCHYPADQPVYVEAVLSTDSGSATFRRELRPNGQVAMLVDGAEVSRWPLPFDLAAAARPFIMQHALKELLLAKPDERFQGFARMLGLDRLDQFHKDFVSLCTKPEALLDARAESLLATAAEIEGRVATEASLKKVAQALKKAADDPARAYEAVWAECRRRVPAGTEDRGVVPFLEQLRADAAGKAFRGSITLVPFTEQECQAREADLRALDELVSEGWMARYFTVAALATVVSLLNRADFFDRGLALLESGPADVCPLCGKSLDQPDRDLIHERHHTLATEKDRNETLEGERQALQRSLLAARQGLQRLHRDGAARASAFLSVRSDLGGLSAILGPSHPDRLAEVERALDELAPAAKGHEESYEAAFAAVAAVQASLEECKQTQETVEALSDALREYAANAKALSAAVARNAPLMARCSAALKTELDALAGTRDIALLVELVERRPLLQRAWKLRSYLVRLKELRKAIDQQVAARMHAAVTSELTDDVMGWYAEIRTTTDPDVHFGGFDLERTAGGDFRARRIKVRATSYGKELVSAVSSLSESKLNALGLRMSIARNLKSGGPGFGFLVIDDPIQSWDAEHETQFVSVLQKLVDDGKQVIVLTHNRNWAECLRTGCRSLNGRYYEITGYSVEGPHLSEKRWTGWENRLQEVMAICNNPDADSVRLQQGEEEIRIVLGEMASELLYRTKQVRRSASSLNAAKVRSILAECNVNVKLIDRLSQTFETTDDAHHAPQDYAAQRERLKRYHSWVKELERDYLKAPAPPKA